MPSSEDLSYLISPPLYHCTAANSQKRPGSLTFFAAKTFYTLQKYSAPGTIWTPTPFVSEPLALEVVRA